MPPARDSHQTWHSQIRNVVLPQIQLNKKCLLLNFDNQSSEKPAVTSYLRGEENVKKLIFSALDLISSHKSGVSRSQAVCPVRVSDFLSA